MSFLFSDDFCAEGEKGEFGDLEKLPSEGNADDREAEKHAEEGVFNRHRDAGKKEPEDIGDELHRPSSVMHLFSEGEEGKGHEFEALKSDWNTDDR